MPRVSESRMMSSLQCLKRVLGRCGLVGIERLMGILLIAIVAQMLLGGISACLETAA